MRAQKSSRWQHDGCDAAGFVLGVFSWKIELQFLLRALHEIFQAHAQLGVFHLELVEFVLNVRMLAAQGIDLRGELFDNVTDLLKTVFGG